MPATQPGNSAGSRLAYQTRVVLRLGTLILGAGASAYRVKVAMSRLAHAVGLAQVSAVVTSQSITLTARTNSESTTQTAEERSMGVNAAKLDRLNRFTVNLPKAVLVEDADAALTRIERTTRTYPRWLLALVTGIACAGFCFLNHGGWVECGAVFLGSILGQVCRLLMAKWNWNTIGVAFLAGMIASAAYLGLVVLWEMATGDATIHQAGVVSSILFLIPGFPLVTALLDVLRLDMLAGLTRGFYAGFLFLAAGMAVWASAWLVGADMFEGPTYVIPEPWLFLLRVGATFLASGGFAMLFTAAPSAALMAGVNGAIINSLRLTLQDAGAYNVVVCGLAALAAGVIAHFLARVSPHSRVSLSVPAVVVMIPGVSFFRAVSSINAGDAVAAVQPLFNCALVILAIGAGLAAARMLTDPHWGIEKPCDAVPYFGDSRVTLTPRIQAKVRAAVRVKHTEGGERR